MGLFLLVAISLLVIFVGYKCYKVAVTRSSLSWTARVPGWPLLGNLLMFTDTTDLLNILSRVTAKYGKIVSLEVVTVPLIVSTDYDFNEFILSSKTVLTKLPDYQLLSDLLGTGLLTSSGTKWKQRRKLITPAFHFSILEQFIESFESNGNVLIEKIEQNLGEPVYIDQYMDLYTLDVICEAAMGVKINAQADSKSQYVRAVRDFFRITIEKSFSFVKNIPFLYWFTRDYKIEKESLKYLNSTTNFIIDSRKEKLEKSLKKEANLEDCVGTKKKMAFLDILLHSTIDGEPLSREDIREEVATFMVAGHDTTASAITFLLYSLADHTDIQQRVVDEQMLLFQDDLTRNVTYQDLQNMKYLECVIKETLRLYPSVPGFGRYVEEDIYYKGNLIPAGVNIGIFAYQALRDPEYFPDPDKFDPSRFEENAPTRRPYAFIPFSAGPRNCIGQKFAVMEIKTSVSKILRKFNVLPCPEHKVKPVGQIVLKTLNGVKVKFEERKLSIDL